MNLSTPESLQQEQFHRMSVKMKASVVASHSPLPLSLTGCFNQ